MNKNTKKPGLEEFLIRASETPDPREELTQSVLNAHDYIQGSYYVSHPNFDLGQNGDVNDAILISLVNSILGRNLLVRGNPGLGKTTTAEAVSSLLYNLPIEFVDKGMLQGHPFLTEEKIFGRADLSKINKGEGEEVIFSLFSQTPSVKITDEINRIPPQTQNALMKAVETGQFSYLDRFINSGVKYPFFATANYQDIGNTGMSPPFLDRFDASVEVSQPLWLGNYLMGEPNLVGLTEDKRKVILDLKKATTKLIETNPERASEIQGEARKYMFEIMGTPDIEEQRSRVSNSQLSDRLHDIFSDTHASYKSKLEETSKIQEKFKEQVEDISINKERINALKEIGKSFPFNPDSQIYWNAFMDHVNCIPKNPGDNVPNHYDPYPVGMIENELSVRSRTRGREFLGLISYLKGEDSISVETIEQTLPHLIAHRAVFSDSVQADSNDDLTNSLSMRNAKNVVKDFSQGIYSPHKEDFEKLYGSMNTPHKTAEIYADHTEPSLKEFGKRFSSKE